MTIKEPPFTQEDVEWIDSLRGYLVDDDWQFAVGLRLRLQQWIDQQNGTRWENGRLVPALSYFRVADEIDLPGKGL